MEQSLICALDIHMPPPKHCKPHGPSRHAVGGQRGKKARWEVLDQKERQIEAHSGLSCVVSFMNTVSKTANRGWLTICISWEAGVVL